MMKLGMMNKIKLIILCLLVVATAKAQYTPINAGESGLIVRTKLNAMLSELYGLQTDFDNLELNNGDDRYIRIEIADGGATGDDLTISAGSNDDGQGGGDLILRGGGSLEFGDVFIGANDQFSSIYLLDTVRGNGLPIKNIGLGVELTDVATMANLSSASGSDSIRFSSVDGYLREYRVGAVNDSTSLDGRYSQTYSITLPSAGTSGSVQTRVNGVIDYPTGWVLAAASNDIDLNVTHNLGRRVSNVNVVTVNGDVEQLLRPFAGAYSGWLTNSDNQLQVTGLATISQIIKIYISFE